MTSAPSPACTRWRRPAMLASSSSRPTKGVAARNAVGSSASYSTSTTPTGSGRPFKARGPRSRQRNAPRAATREAHRGAAGEEPRHGAAAEDLTGLGPVAEAAGGHDGRPEVAAARVAHDLADVEADAHPQPLAVDRPPRTLLHRDRAAHRF